MIVSIPRSPVLPIVSANNDMFGNDFPTATFNWTLQNLTGKHPYYAQRDSMIAHLGEHEWMDLVWVVAFTVVWDPGQTFWCSKFPANSEDHMEECFGCGLNGTEKENWLYERVGEDDEYLGIESAYRGDQAIYYASDLVSTEDEEHGLIEWTFSGSFRQLTTELTRVDRVLTH